jgi:ABC-type multidrug transport system ATPase subunit/ABC-type multidrug transport system permease subunit
MSVAPIIRATGLTKRFDNFTAVDGLSFAVEPGSIFAFLGANGSGKSTTIRMLIGLLTPTAGTIEVDGIDVIRHPRIVRDHIGYMGQRVSLYPGLTLRENLEFYAGLYDLTGRTLERRWGALRERFALGDAEHEDAGELPAGIRQRAGLALSTLHRPRVLFLDEPTAGVDVQNRLRFWDLIQEEAQAGVTVFVTTHFLEEVEYCDWVCFIDAGRLIANATPEEMRRRYSSGYRITLSPPPEARAEIALAWRQVGAEVAATDHGLVVRPPALTPAVLDVLAATTGQGIDGRAHVQQPEMGAVFQELMRIPRASISAPRAEAETEAGQTAAATPPPSLARSATELGGAPRTTASSVLAARWRRLRTLMRREARATLRDPFTVAMLILVPIGALLAFGYTLSVDVKNLALGVHDASDTTESRRFIAELAANGTFAPRRFATRERLAGALVSGDISVGVVIPPDFDRQLRDEAVNGRPAEVQVLYDGGETVLAGNAEASLGGIARATGAALTQDAPGGAPTNAGSIGVVTRALFNPRLDGVPFMVAGSYGFVLTFLTTLITAVSIVNEKLSGTFEQLQVTPATAAEIVLGKILPLGAVFTLDVVLMMLLAGLLLGVWPAGSAIFFVIVSAFYIVISLALGLIFSATSGSAAEAVQKTVLFSIPLNFVGGFVFPVRNMPVFFRSISILLPATHFISISRAIYLRAAGPLILLPKLAVIAGYGVVLMAFAFRTIAKRA